MRVSVKARLLTWPSRPLDIMEKLSSIDLQEKLHLLLAEESRLADALSAVRTDLNDLAPISALPAEVLEEIFGICVSWLYGHHKPKYRLAWTQVCRNWRHVSLNSTRLWQCIDICDSRLAHEFLIRSGTAPISIISASPLKLCTDNLQPHAERLQSIEVFLFPDDMNDLFTSIGPNLSNLTNLSLKIPPVSTNFVLNIQFPLTRLRKLLLDCVAIPWNSCRGLTHLSLRGLGPDSPSIPQLHDIFEASPQLEYLRLESITPALTDDSLPPVFLPRLRELSITGKAHIIFSLLSSLSLSSTTRLQLTCSVFDDLHSLLPMGRNWGYTSNAEADTVRLGQRAIRFIRPGACPWTEEPSDFFISLASSSSIPKSVLPHIQSLLDLSHITSLELSTGVIFEIPLNLLTTFLAHLINLESLLVAFNDLEELLHALSSPSNLSDSPLPLCPRLRTMSFSRPGDIWWHFKEQWIPPLLALAKSRHKSSFPLASLEFKQCHDISPEIAEEFKGLVRDINVVEHVATPVVRRPFHSWAPAKMSSARYILVPKNSEVEFLTCIRLLTFRHYDSLICRITKENSSWDFNPMCPAKTGRMERSVYTQKP